METCERVSGMLHWWKRLLGLVLLRTLTPRVIPLCTPLPVRLFLGSDLPPLLPLLSSSHGVADCEIIPVVDGAPFSTVPFVPPRLSCDPLCALSLEISFLYGKDESFVPEFPFGKLLRTVLLYLTRWKYVTFNLRSRFPFRRLAPLSTTRCSLLCPCGPRVPCSILQLYG